MVLQVIGPLLFTLVELHKQEIVHRDIKPENVFFNSDGMVKLGGFLLASPIGTVDRSELVGTIDYISPEALLAAAAKHRKVGLPCLELIGVLLGFMVQGLWVQGFSQTHFKSYVYLSRPDCLFPSSSTLVLIP